MNISVLVATKDRPKNLKQLVKSLGYQKIPFSLCIIDQSQIPINVFDLKKELKGNSVTYIHTKPIGKSKALNLGLQKITTEYVAFTDDDCIAHPDWLNNFVNVFETKKVDAIFGQTLPYNPKKNRGLFCPSTNIFKKNTYLLTPQKHWLYVGYGNNMAYKTDAIRDIGGLETLLGPGSPTKAAEDADLIMKTFLNKKVVYRSTKSIVLHNKWLNNTQRADLEKDYYLGHLACYGSFKMSGNMLSKQIMEDEYVENRKFFLNYRNYNNPIKIISKIKILFKGYFYAKVIYLKRMRTTK